MYTSPQSALQVLSFYVNTTSAERQSVEKLSYGPILWILSYIYSQSLWTIIFHCGKTTETREPVKIALARGGYSNQAQVTIQGTQNIMMFFIDVSILQVAQCVATSPRAPPLFCSQTRGVGNCHILGVLCFPVHRRPGKNLSPDTSTSWGRAS
jgi:hypothetical protein